MSELIQLIIRYEKLPTDNEFKPLYDFNLMGIPTDMIEPIVAALTAESLSRAGIKYEQTYFEKQFRIKIDTFRALRQAADARKSIIENNDRIEREKSAKRYQEHCQRNVLDVKQIYIDFPIS